MMVLAALTVAALSLPTGADSLPTRLEPGNLLRVPRTATPPVMDGRLDDPAWRGAALLDQWVQVKPGDNIAPEGRTEARLLYDREHLYIAVRAWDDRAKVRAVLHERDAVIRSSGQEQGQDYVGIRLDTFNDRRQAYGIAVNPLGLQGDGIEVEGTGFTEWDGTFDTKGMLLEDGWSVEIRIPLRSLRYPAQAEHEWGFLMTRGYGRETMEDSPIPRNRDLACSLCQAITLTGISDIATSRAIEVNPTLVTRASASRPELGQPFGATDAGLEVGANVKLGLSPSLTLDGTINPDFSQVEADAGQLDINNRFALFFPEKRPFFLEGANIFETRFPLPGADPGYQTPPINLVYTRQIVDPLGGAKLSGQAGRTSVGLIAALDDYAGYVLDDPIGGIAPGSLDPFAGERPLSLVARAQVDVLSDGFLGLTGTRRSFAGSHSQLGAIDARLRFGANLQVRALLARSDASEADVAGPVRGRLGEVLSGAALEAALDSVPSEALDLDGESRRGTGLQVQAEWTSRNWEFGAGVLDITPGFETRLGFTPRSDQILYSGFLRYQYRGTGFVKSLIPAVRLEQGYEHDGDRLLSHGARTDFMARANLDVSLPAATEFSAGYSRLFIRYEDIDFDDLDRSYVYLSTRPTRQLSAYVFLRAGEEVIYDDIVEEGPPLPNTFVSLSGSLGLRPIPALRLDLSFSGSRIWRRTAAVSRESLYAESAIPRLVLRWQLSPRLGVRGIGEYRIERFYDRSGTVADQAEGLFADVLASYIVHPNQSIQVGIGQAGEGDLATSPQWTRRGGLVKLSYVLGL